MDEDQSKQLHEFFRSRRSVRRFLREPIPLHIVKRILETATYAPSAHNRQPWRFILLEEKKTEFVLQLGERYRWDLLENGYQESDVNALVNRSQQRILNAPMVILVCLDIACGDKYPDSSRQQAEFLMGVQGVAMAGALILLAAHAEGLGGVWMCAPLFAPEIVKDVLELPWSWLPQGLILLGYPEEVPPTPPRRALDEVMLIA